MTRPAIDWEAVEREYRAGVKTLRQIADEFGVSNPAIVKREVESAGFKFVGEDNAIRNPADDKTVNVFDPKIRGKTDQFVYKFQKPKA